MYLQRMEKNKTVFNPQPKAVRIKLPRNKYKQLKIDVLKRDRNRCQLCGKFTNSPPHHVLFRSQGGSDILENLITLCRDCHNMIHHGKESRYYRERIKEKIKGIYEQ